MTVPPNEIPGYEVLAKIGEGGRGTVYRARQLSLDRLVAVKILSPELASDAEYTTKFLEEARAAGKLSHPNIVQAIEAGVHNGIWYFVMELVENGSLHERLANVGRFSEAETLDVAQQMAQALDFAWRRARLIHRDIKPANILLTADGRSKLADLGLAQRHGAPADKAGFTEGTPQYCAPEQCRGQTNLDIRTDLYALGGTLYHLICGRPTFDGDNPAVVMGKQISETPPSPRSLNPQISPAFEAVILKLLAKDPAQRFQSPAELLKEVERLQAIQRGETPVVPVATAARRSPVNIWVLTFVGVAVLIGVVVWIQAPAFSGKKKPAAPSAAGMASKPAATLPSSAIPAGTQAVAALSSPPKPTTAVPAVASITTVTNAPPVPAGPSEADVQKILESTAALVRESKFVEAETALRKFIEPWQSAPLPVRLKAGAVLAKLDVVLQETQAGHAAYDKKMAEEAAAKAAADAARREQAEAQARTIIASTEGWVRSFYLEYACQYMTAQIAKSPNVDVRARLEARVAELQLLAESKNCLIAAVGKGTLPSRAFTLVRGRTLQGKPVSATADSLSIAVGVGTIAFRWSDLTESTIYSLLQASVTPQDGRALAGLALYAWETSRAPDAIRYYEQARNALGDQLPEPVRRRAQAVPGS